MWILLYRYSPSTELCDICIELHNSDTQAQERICAIATEWAAKNRVKLNFSDSEQLDKQMYNLRQAGKPYLEFDISYVEAPTAVF